MLYTVQVRLDGGSNLAAQMAEIREWLDHHRFEPDVFQHRMAADHVLIRIDFKIGSEAVAFSEAFGGTLLNVK